MKGYFNVCNWANETDIVLSNSTDLMNLSGSFGKIKEVLVDGYGIDDCGGSMG